MDRPEHNTADFFIGREVEHTAMHDERTLFVVGVHPVEDIVLRAIKNNVRHIYCGANMSFDVTENTVHQWAPWEEMVFGLLRNDYWVTLDLDVSQVEGLLESGLTEHRRFIPMISVKLPYIDLLNYNTVIKIDDKDFDKSNPGVWCHSLHDLKKQQCFTDWDLYTQDEVIE